MHSAVTIAPWLRELLVDPIGKRPLSQDGGFWVAECGFQYGETRGVLDLRRPTLFDRGSDWKAGQEAYEQWSTQLGIRDARSDYLKEIESVRSVYAAIPVSGRVLDVGGHQGRLRAFLKPDQEYVSCDPFLDAFQGLDRQPNLRAAYSCLDEPCNFVAAHAEHLPFASQSFDTVHMRSVIDHFRDPALALIEAFRVLRPGGHLVVGLTVEGGRAGRVSAKDRVKEAVRTALPWIGINRFTDHHIWHPTYAELRNVIESSGFDVLTTHWQAGWSDKVCYIDAKRRERHP